jgi:SAM-dependent methyltransferase
MLCPLCESSSSQVIEESIKDYEYGVEEEYKWLKCQDCGLVRVDPIPSPEVLNKAYPPHYHSYVKPTSVITRTLISMLRKLTAKKIKALVPQEASLLEIGCSTGDLLEEIGKNSNYGLYGVEYREAAAKEAESKGIKIWQGSLEEADIQENQMDLVIMNHVLEHVYNPVTTLQQLCKILKPGGKIIGELPNIDCWDFYLFGKYWGGGHVPRHIWHFTPEILRHCLERCGFSKIKISPSLHTGTCALSVQTLFRCNKDNCDDLKFGRTWYYPFWLVLLIPINLLAMPLLKTGVMKFEAEVH